MLHSNGDRWNKKHLITTLYVKKILTKQTSKTLYFFDTFFNIDAVLSFSIPLYADTPLHIITFNK